MTADTWARFLDDATPLPEVGLEPRTSPRVGDRAVRDDELPLLVGYDGDVRVVLTGGAGQVAGPAAWCRRNEVELSSLDTALRDLDDPAGNARRVVAAVRAAVDGGDLVADTVVHVRLVGAPTPAWLGAADVLAEAELTPCLSLDTTAGSELETWLDACLDRELPVSLVGGSVEQAVSTVALAARLFGDEGDLAAGRRWVRSWLTDDVDGALAHLASL